jgi:leader peptidase (prepilin peptidase)/N-methyltransferase
VSLIDVETRKIPNRVTGPAAILAIVLGLLLRPAGVPIQLGAGLAGAGFLLLFALIHPKGLGMGDVKLAGVLGLYLGASVAVALFAGVLAAAAGGLVVLARAGVAKGRTLKIPLGPYLATGGLLAALAGPAILHWYVHSVLR